MERQKVLCFKKLLGRLSMACDFADLVQNGFCTHPVAPLQGSFGPRSCTSPAVSRLNIHPPNRCCGDCQVVLGRNQVVGWSEASKARPDLRTP
jgi:hypothetical protein